MLRKSWRYLAVLLALGLLASLTVGAALAAQPNGKGKGNGPKNKGKIVHVNGTVVSASGSTLVVRPKQKGNATPTAAASAASDVTFTIATNTKLAAEGAAPGTTVDLSQFTAGARVNVVGRSGANGSVVAKVAVLLGPDDDTGD